MMNALGAVKEEPIPGYRLIEPLGRGGFGEVWKCEAPGGLFKAIKIVRSNSDHILGGTNGADQELRALQHIKSIRHPFLLSIERVEVQDGDLLIVMELADRSLHDLLVQHRNEGRPGVPRKELIGYLKEAAEVLDLMNREYGLQHLDIKPRNLFLVSNHVKVADFGLVNSLAELCGNGQDLLGGITPLYAAPEVFDGQVTLFSDQYSLAVTWCELLTGALPITAKNAHQLALLVASIAPDLSPLPETDRPIVGRALSKDPRERYPSCQAFLEALESATPQVPSVPPGSGQYASCAAKAGSGSRTRTTAIDLLVADMAATRPTQGGDNATSSAQPTGSGLYRRESRVVSVVRPPDRSANEGPLAGYQLQECLGRGVTGEVWRAIGPRGEPCLVRFLPPDDQVHPAGAAPLERLLQLRHAGLPALEVVSAGGDRLALLSEAGDSNLQTRLKECQAVGQPGLPRAELLAALAHAAEHLDHLYHVCQMQHLVLTPRHLALRGGQILLVDFGLAELLWLPAGLQPAQLNPRYSAVELFAGMISDACDQYSLALMYQELLVGLHPFRNLNARQLATPKLRGQPDVSLLSGPDRPIVLQALHPIPEKRFRSCREFVLALEEATRQAEQIAVTVSPGRSRPSSARVPIPGATLQAPGQVPSVTPGWREAIDELVTGAGRGQEIRTSGSVVYRVSPGSHIEHRCWARLAPELGRLKVDAFREQWQGEMVRRSVSRFQVEVRTASSLLQRCLGRAPALLVDVRLGAQRDPASNRTPIRITIQPSSCGRGRAEQLLAEMGPLLLGSLQGHLDSQSDRLGQERFPLTQTVSMQVVSSKQTITGRTRDVGRDGMCLFAQGPVTPGAVAITLSRHASPLTFQVSGWVRDCVAGDDGQYEIEITFAG